MTNVAAVEREAAKDAEIERLRKALVDVKALVCGDRAPLWVEDGWAVTCTRGMIADVCDVALGNAPATFALKTA